jgi:EmrB/QacA subfamily drug resistance transporter
VPRTRRALTVTALLMVTFMAAMEATVVSTAMPTVIADLGGIEHYAWVFTAYIVASTVTVPILAKLADLYGRRPIMFFGIACFLLGSVGAGVSDNLTELIVARAIQGVGAGGVQPMAMTILGDLYDTAARARVQGWFGGVWGVAGLTGPLLGGLIVDVWSWHWVFFINVPFGLASAAVLFVSLHERVERKQHHLDFAGAGLLAIAIVAVLLGSNGEEQTWLLVVAVAALGGFIWIERRCPEPVLPFSLLRQRVIAVSSIAGALVGGVLIATSTFLPLYVQSVLGGSPTEAGLAIAPMAIGWPLASNITGRILPKVGFQPLVRLGFLLTLAGALALALLLRADSPVILPRFTSGVLGLGLGFANTSLLVAVQGSVGWRQRGVATASTLLFRTLGGALAVGALGAVLSAVLLSDPQLTEAAVSSLLGPDHGRDLDPNTLAGLSTALDTGLRRVLQVIAGLAAAAFAVGLFFPRLSVDAEASASPSSSPDSPQCKSSGQSTM